MTENYQVSYTDPRTEAPPIVVGEFRDMEIDTRSYWADYMFYGVRGAIGVVPMGMKRFHIEKGGKVFSANAKVEAANDFSVSLRVRLRDQ